MARKKARRKRRSKPRVAKRTTHREKNLLKDIAFSLVVSLGFLGVLTLSYVAQGTYLHLSNTLTLFCFVFVSVLVIKHTYGMGKNQAFYSAVLASVGYFAFHRIYNYLVLNNAWKSSPILGDSLVDAVVNAIIIYVTYMLFLYSHKKEK